MILEGIIIKGVGGLYKVAATGNIYDCKARGKFRKLHIIPMVGDRVRIRVLDDGTGIIDEIMPRRNALTRPPVANVDQMIAVIAVAQPEPNLLQLDKLILAAEKQQLDIVICINKIDLDDGMVQCKAISKAYEMAGYNVVYTSVAEPLCGIEDVKRFLRGRITVIAGQSGVGKSSIINAICGQNRMAVGEISAKAGLGKHTTRHVELLAVDGGMIADTPGFSAFELRLTKYEVAAFYREFSLYAAECYFSDCLHLKEPNCAVRQAVEQGLIDRGRYERYVYIQDELEQEKGFVRW
ncbi:ribosome small subunit-dependent GTPase A [Mahella australiensis]|uniref:Small ribosomal subunit biogenesis GTPase RsgA n=1 Tax=Mahella australiensis (strain DSM 15567 / CIP 107919 / 50-1 BON) TaxID=697281 RepID=F4A2E1_MAHA5|nr:ribosome small subunit-dependent GTPase A [Mahella australiensis]AEE96188.1 ribosome small subunit-dependent GTPase A [Mahella australiensis 50-1 BON]